MTDVSGERTFVTVFNSVFLLIYALFAILMIVKKTHSYSLTGKLGIQLLCSSILYSIALLINGEDDNNINKSNDSTNQNKDLSAAQIIQIILTVQSLLTTMSFVSAISYILYTNFRSPEKISNNSRKYLIVLSLICWLLPLPLALISHLHIPPVFRDTETTETFNFIKSMPLYFIFYSLFLITYIITFVCITLLKVEVSKFIKEYGDDPKYIKYIRRLNRLVAIVIISTIIFGIDIVNEVREGGTDGNMDIICDVLEPMIIPFFFFFFAMNADQWNEFKKFYNCKKEPSNVNLIEKDNETELL